MGPFLRGVVRRETRAWAALSRQLRKHSFRPGGTAVLVPVHDEPVLSIAPLIRSLEGCGSE